MAGWGEEFRNPADGASGVLSLMCSVTADTVSRMAVSYLTRNSLTPLSLPNSMHSITDLIAMHICITASLNLPIFFRLTVAPRMQH